MPNQPATVGSPSLADQIRAQQEQGEINKRRVAAAFQAVFGKDRARNDNQLIVWNCLRNASGQETPKNILDKNGRIDSESVVFNEGSRQFYLYIEGQVKLASENADQPKTKVRK